MFVVYSKRLYFLSIQRTNVLYVTNKQFLKFYALSNIIDRLENYLNIID